MARTYSNGVMSTGGALVGRRVALAAAIEGLTDRAGPITAICGEPGIGKSRLVAAAAEKVGEDGWIVLHGWCLDLLEKVPFLPVVDVLRGLAALDAGRLIRAGLAGCPPFVAPEIVQLLPQLQSDPSVAPGPPDASPWRRDRLFAAVQLLLNEVGASTRLAVVIEDAHWADPSTLDWLRYQATPSHLIAAAVLVTARTSGASTVRDIVERSSGRWLEIGPLSTEDTTELVLARAHYGAGAVTRIVELSGGNPLFAERLMSAESTDRLPVALTELFAAQLDRTSPEERSLLVALSVGRRPFGASELSTLAELTPNSTDKALRGLVRQGLVDRAETDGFRPHHALVAEVLREQGTGTEARGYHRRLAAVLAARDDVTIAGEVADHYQAGSDDASEAQWRLRAARYADSVGAPLDATRHWRRLVEMSQLAGEVPTGADVGLVDLYLSTLSAMGQAGSEDVFELAEQALPTLLPQVEAVDQVRLLFELGSWQRITDPAAAAELLQQAVDIGEQHLPTRAYFMALHHLAFILGAESHGQLEAQVELLERARRAAREIRLTQDEKFLTVFLARQYVQAGDAATTRRLLAEASAMKSDRIDPWIEIRTGMCLTDVLGTLGDLKDAVQTGTTALSAARQNGLEHSFDALMVLSNTMASMQELGQTTAARSLGSAWDSEPVTRTSFIACAVLASTELAAGNPGGATRFWDDHEELLADLGASFEGVWVALRCDYLLWLDRAAEVAGVAWPVLQRLAPTDESRYSGELFILAARACADLAQTARARGDDAAADAAARDLSTLDDLRARCVVDPLASSEVPVEAGTAGETWRAERGRAHGSVDVEPWAAAAAVWAECARPHRTAYALWRHAEVLYADPNRRAAASRTLREAHRLAEGHQPLRAGIETLARHANTDLSPATRTRPADPPPRPLGLTERELAVLTLVAQGLTNAQIGARLFISPKTVSIHVSSILRKLRVSSRVHAAIWAAQAGLVADDPGP